MEKSKKNRRIVGWSIVAAVVAVLVVVYLCIDGIVEKKVTEHIQKLAADSPLTLEWSDLDIRMFHGSVSVEGLNVELVMPDSLTGDSAFVKMHVPYLYAGHINWLKVARHRVLHIDRINVSRPVLTTRSPEEVMKALEQLPQDTTPQQIPLSAIELDRFKLVNASGDVTNITDKLHLSLDSLSLTLHDLAFTFADTSFTLCDSVYMFDVRNLLYCSEDGLTSATVKRVHTADAGPIYVEGVEGGNTDKPKEHAHRMGNVAATWMQFSMRDIHTSPINLFLTAKNKELKLDSVRISGNSMTIYRDDQYPAKEKYPMPQEDMMKSEMPFLINLIHIDFDKFAVSLTDNGKNVGSLAFTHNDIKMKNVTNKEGSVVTTAVTNRLADGGKVKVGMEMTVNQACSFHFVQDMTDTHGTTLADFTVPLMGVALGADIHSIHLDCKGNKNTLAGTFCMQYDSLTMHVEEDSPVEDLAKTAGIVNLFAPMVLQKQNPRHPGQPAESFEVKGTHNPWKPFPFYFMDPITEGIMKTILPLGIAESVLKSQQKAAQSKKK